MVLPSTYCPDIILRLGEQLVECKQALFGKAWAMKLRRPGTRSSTWLTYAYQITASTNRPTTVTAAELHESPLSNAVLVIDLAGNFQLVVADGLRLVRLLLATLVISAKVNWNIMIISDEDEMCNRLHCCRFNMLGSSLVEEFVAVFNGKFWLLRSQVFSWTCKWLIGSAQ